MIVIYGIKNCDTMKKARVWLETHGIVYKFHDYKTAGVEKAVLERWIAQLGWETVLNRAGTTFRKLPEAHRLNLTEKKAIELMLARPSMIKRPILEAGDGVAAGFSPERYENLLARWIPVPKRA